MKTWKNLRISLQMIPAQMTKILMSTNVCSRGQVAKFLSFETLDKIKKYNFSIGILAPAWTMDEHTLAIGLNPFLKHQNDELFQQCMAWDHLFWLMLWRYLYTCGSSTMPFYTIHHFVWVRANGNLPMVVAKKKKSRIQFDEARISTVGASNVRLSFRRWLSRSFVSQFPSECQQFAIIRQWFPLYT